MDLNFLPRHFSENTGEEEVNGGRNEAQKRAHHPAPLAGRVWGPSQGSCDFLLQSWSPPTWFDLKPTINGTPRAISRLGAIDSVRLPLACYFFPPALPAPHHRQRRRLAEAPPLATGWRPRLAKNKIQKTTAHQINVGMAHR
jgi:hypothetical protein